MRALDEAHWRDSARRVKLFVWDGSAVYALLIFIVHIRLWTFTLALVTMVFMTLLNKYGFTPRVFGRWLRSQIAGKRKVTVPWWSN